MHAHEHTNAERERETRMEGQREREARLTDISRINLITARAFTEKKKEGKRHKNDSL